MIFKRTTTLILLAVLLLAVLAGCGTHTPAKTAAEAGTTPAPTDETETTSAPSGETETVSAPSGETEDAKSYKQIDQETAKEMMKRDDGHVIVDVRRQDEYDAGHIPGAILIPNESIGGEKPAELPDADQIILVYCRSGRRSKEASQKLFDMGYTNVYEFGGIIDWTGEIEK